MTRLEPRASLDKARLTFGDRLPDAQTRAHATRGFRSRGYARACGHARTHVDVGCGCTRIGDGGTHVRAHRYGQQQQHRVKRECPASIRAAATCPVFLICLCSSHFVCHARRVRRLSTGEVGANYPREEDRSFEPAACTMLKSAYKATCMYQAFSVTR